MINVTQDELDKFYKKAAAMFNRCKFCRRGQIYFNVAYDFWPEEVNKIRGTDDDCFYDDSKINAFLSHFNVIVIKDYSVNYNEWNY